ncbi:glycoside hydrolase family 18 protein [Candidatus Villigracilis affinis]|uniref:glycoside hydrolase family 18 protein n=1 Tax=Candidatus Villigracilis affinis TaxID=3140682 RepID=UPI001D2FFCC9|nr:glycoside hydrolase family 18 protein [Anaerolineales bacterium]
MPEKPSFRIVAYATDAIITSLIPYDQLTHINYSFLIPNPDGTFKTLNNSWKLEEIVTAAHEKNVRVSIAVGGWGWDNEFEAMAAVPEARSAFVQNLVAVVDQYHLDGVDIDWEYPDQGQSSQNFLALMKELRRALPEKEISTAVISFGDDTGLGIPSEVFELVDYVNVMTYDGDIHGSLVEFEKGLEYWSGRGVPKEKINIGVPFYTRPSEISFAKLVQFDPAAAQVDSFEYNGSPEKYNGIPAVQAKTKLAMQNAGGIMFWALDHDAQGEYSLVKAIFEVVHK